MSSPPFRQAQLFSSPSPSSTSNKRTAKRTSSSLSMVSPTSSSKQLEVVAALHRQSEMVRKIKEVQSFSPSPYLQSAFAPSICSTKPRREKFENTEFDNNNRSHSSLSTNAATRRRQQFGGKNGPPPAELFDLSTSIQQRQVRSGTFGGGGGGGGGKNITTTRTDSSASLLLNSTDNSNSNNDNNFSPVANRIFSGSQQVREFNHALDKTKQSLEKQVRVEPTEVVQHDDIRVTRKTKSEQKRANFLRGVIGEDITNSTIVHNGLLAASSSPSPSGKPNNGNKNNGGEENAASSSRSFSSSSATRKRNGKGRRNSPPTAAATGRPNSAAGKYENEEEEDISYSFRALTPNPDLVPQTSIRALPKFVSTKQGAQCIFRPASHAPTDMTRNTCKALCQFKNLQNAAKKIGATKLDLSSLEATVTNSMRQNNASTSMLLGKNSTQANNNTNKMSEMMMMEDQQQSDEKHTSVAAALALMHQRRGGLVRGTK